MALQDKGSLSKSPTEPYLMITFGKEMIFPVYNTVPPSVEHTLVIPNVAMSQEQDVADYYDLAGFDIAPLEDTKWQKEHNSVMYAIAPIAVAK